LRLKGSLLSLKVKMVTRQARTTKPPMLLMYQGRGGSGYLRRAVTML
jgi:hypothetical protein